MRRFHTPVRAGDDMRDKKFTTPPDFHPDLLPERLSAVAETLANAKNELFAAADPSEGDGGWGVGCHGADRGRIRLRDRLAPSVDYLTFRAEGSLAYWISIGEVPIRISRLDTEPPTLCERQRTAVQQLTFEGFPSSTPFDLRLQLDQTTTKVLKDRRVVRAILCVMEGDNEIASWQVWPRTESGVMPLPTPLRPAPVALPAATFTINDDKEHEGTGD